MSFSGKLPWNSIIGFHEERYCFLSNFYEARVEYGGLVYNSNEAAFQAQKCMTEEEKVSFTEYGPGKSKGAGRRVQLRPDWEAVKVGIMEEIARVKFMQHPELAAKLLATGDMILVEGNHWGDICWGVDIYCSLRYPDDFSKAIVAAVNHSGDSDSTGAITGNILGSWLGYKAIEEKWKVNLKMKGVILEMAEDLCFGCPMYGDDYSDMDKDWLRKYCSGHAR